MQNYRKVNAYIDYVYDNITLSSNDNKNQPIELIDIQALKDANDDIELWKKDYHRMNDLRKADQVFYETKIKELETKLELITKTTPNINKVIEMRKKQFEDLRKK